MSWAAVLSHPVPWSEIKALGRGAGKMMAGRPGYAALGAAGGLGYSMMSGDNHGVRDTVLGGLGGAAARSMGPHFMAGMESGGMKGGGLAVRDAMRAAGKAVK